MGTGANGPVRAAVLQSDDKLIIAGLFSKYNGITRGNIARPIRLFIMSYLTHQKPDDISY